MGGVTVVFSEGNLCFEGSKRFHDTQSVGLQGVHDSGDDRLYILDIYIIQNPSNE
jgi:hypothetical protein